MQQPETAGVSSILQLKNILVPTDFSDESLKAVHYGSAFARRFSATLLLLHVVPPAPVFAGFEAVPLVADDPDILKNSEEHLAQFATKHIPMGAAVTQLVRFGSPFEEIVSIGKARNIDLIVVSTHGHTGIKRVAFGSTAERIINRAGCPVLVVREKEREFVSGQQPPFDNAIRINRILVAIDFSDSSRKALQYAIGFAKQFDSSVTCVHILNVPYGAGEAGIAVELETFQKAFHVDAEKKMAALLKETGASVETEKIIRTGGPYHEVIKVADERQIDLIVTGTHARTGVGHFLLGSTAERIVRHAHCSVLVVREKERDFVTATDRATWR
jgi:nucleotide-binding universal stress UspA family protein